MKPSIVQLEAAVLRQLAKVLRTVCKLRERGLTTEEQIAATLKGSEGRTLPYRRLTGND